MSSYHDGRRIEYAVCHDLADNGYRVTRAASSKGVADVIAIKPGEIALVNVKRTKMPGPAERLDLWTAAQTIGWPVVPLVALGPASKLTYRRLTGPGPADWEPWTPDEIGRPNRQEKPMSEQDWHYNAQCAEAQFEAEVERLTRECLDREATEVDARERLRRCEERLARVGMVADEWFAKAEGLAPDDDWGQSITDTIAADTLRSVVRTIRTAMA